MGKTMTITISMLLLVLMITSGYTLALGSESENLATIQLPELSDQPLVISFGETDAEITAMEILKNYFPDINILKFSTTTVSLAMTTELPVIWLGHGQTDGMISEGQTIHWNWFIDTIQASVSDNHFILACDSLSVAQATQHLVKNVIGFRGVVDATYAALLTSDLLYGNDEIQPIVQYRIREMSMNPEVVKPLAMQDENEGSTYDFSPNEYDVSSYLVYVYGTGGFHWEVNIKTWFKADQDFVDYYDDNSNLVYVHEIEIRKYSGTTTHIFGYDNAYVVSNEISNSEAKVDDPDLCFELIVCVDPPDNPEFEWIIPSPEDLTVGHKYDLHFVYYTDGNPAAGCFDYRLLLTAELDGEGLLYGLYYYYYFTRNYDLLMWSEPFQVCNPNNLKVTVSWSGNGVVFEKLGRSAINYYVWTDLPAYVDISFTIREQNYDPYSRYVYLYRGSNKVGTWLLSTSSNGGTQTFSINNILIYGSTEFTIVIHWGGYDYNTYGLKSISHTGYYNQLNLYNVQTGAESDFV